MKPRHDDFEKRREHLKNLSDQQLKTYFETLTDQLIDPLLEMAYQYTTPAIERSVLLRMGFSSIEAKQLTDKMMEYQLLEYGAGHIIFRYAKDHHISIREAGMTLLSPEVLLAYKEEFLR